MVARNDAASRKSLSFVLTTMSVTTSLQLVEAVRTQHSHAAITVGRTFLSSEIITVDRVILSILQFNSL